MEKTLSPILIVLLILGCKTEQKQQVGSFSDLNLIVETARQIDSVWISDIGQRESHILRFTDTIKVNLKRKVNDLYNLYFYTKGATVKKQLWLDGENVIIKGEIDEEFEIDTVLHSDLYYTSVDFSSAFNTLIQHQADSDAVDHFLLQRIQQNTDNPLSFEIASFFILRNQNNPKKIRELYDLLNSQNDTLKNHLISAHSQIENILEIDAIDISEYQFYNINQKLTSIDVIPKKDYLLDFWFVSCAPCLKDHKIMAKKLEVLKDHRVELISISIDKKQSDWKEYLLKYNYHWKHYREVDSLASITSAMDIGAFPTYLLINGEGTIKGRFNSFGEVEKYLMQ